MCQLHCAVIDRRLLVENMEIRQAEGRGSPAGEFEKKPEASEVFPNEQVTLKVLFFSSTPRFISMLQAPLTILKKTLRVRSAGFYSSRSEQENSFTNK